MESIGNKSFDYVIKHTDSNGYIIAVGIDTSNSKFELFIYLPGNDHVYRVINVGNVELNGVTIWSLSQISDVDEGTKAYRESWTSIEQGNLPPGVAVTSGSTITATGSVGLGGTGSRYNIEYPAGGTSVLIGNAFTPPTVTSITFDMDDDSATVIVELGTSNSNQYYDGDLVHIYISKSSNPNAGQDDNILGNECFANGVYSETSKTVTFTFSISEYEVGDYLYVAPYAITNTGSNPVGNIAHAAIPSSRALIYSAYGYNPYRKIFNLSWVRRGYSIGGFTIDNRNGHQTNQNYTYEIYALNQSGDQVYASYENNTRYSYSGLLLAEMPSNSFLVDPSIDSVEGYEVKDSYKIITTIILKTYYGGTYVGNSSISFEIYPKIDMNIFYNNEFEAEGRASYSEELGSYVLPITKGHLVKGLRYAVIVGEDANSYTDEFNNSNCEAINLSQGVGFEVYKVVDDCGELQYHLYEKDGYLYYTYPLNTSGVTLSPIYIKVTRGATLSSATPCLRLNTQNHEGFTGIGSNGERDANTELNAIFVVKKDASGNNKFVLLNNT